MKLGRRLPRSDEREDTAIDSMMLGTIDGFSKVGMPIDEVTRQPLAAEPVPSGGVYQRSVDDPQNVSSFAAVQFPTLSIDEAAWVTFTPPDLFTVASAPWPVNVAVTLSIRTFSDTIGGSITVRIDAGGVVDEQTVNPGTGVQDFTVDLSADLPDDVEVVVEFVEELLDGDVTGTAQVQGGSITFTGAGS